MAAMHSRGEILMSSDEDEGGLGEILDISGRVQRNPYGMVAGAMGIGFVLGGGLFTRLTAKVAGAGLRIGVMAALPILQREFVRALTQSKYDHRYEGE